MYYTDLTLRGYRRFFQHTGWITPSCDLMAMGVLRECFPLFTWIPHASILVKASESLGIIMNLKGLSGYRLDKQANL